MILKRKINTESDYPEKHIQEFKPASGKIKIKKATDLLNVFANSTYDNNGLVKTTEFKKNPKGCQFCPYRDLPDLCDKGRPQNKWRNPFEIF